MPGARVRDTAHAPADGVLREVPGGAQRQRRADPLAGRDERVGALSLRPSGSRTQGGRRVRIAGSLLIGLALVGCGGLPPAGGPKMTLTWAAATGAEEYVIERAEAGTFQEIARLPATRTEYVDRTVRTGVQYCYQVRARNRQGVSPPSPQQCGTPKP